MLDLGANTDCDATNLVQFAVMGAAYARTAMGLERPRVALLNIGTEDLKGTGEIRDAAAMLRGAEGLPMDFTGFIEGDKLSRGHVDVIVHDRSEEHTSELQSLMRISYAVFCLKKKNT